ncbi:MAG: aminotransferase class V-fold PLP-dependent enzyme [Minicystis sp.]
MSERRESNPPFTARLGDRSLYPDLTALAYLNHGGISPASIAMRHAVTTVVDDYGKHGAGAFPHWMEQRSRLKGKLARMIGVRPDDLAFVPNTTRGVIDIALCFPWEKDDRLVVFAGEFPANVTPWQQAASTFGLEVIFLPVSDFFESEEQGLTRLQQTLSRGGVRLVAVSAVEFQTGLPMPLGKLATLCHAHGAELFVDAVQALGAVPLDAGKTDIDYLACGSHKWLMGLEGAGFVYIRPDRVPLLRPTVAGWLSHEEGLRFLFEGEGLLRYDRPIRKSASFLEGGNFNTIGLAALEASVDLILSLGVQTIYEYINGYNNRLETGLLERGLRSLRQPEPERRSATLSMLPAASSGVTVVALHKELNARGIACATPDGVLRFTPHWPNHLGEIPRVLAAMDESLAALGG